MDLTKWIILGVAVVALITAGVFYLRKRQKSVVAGFEQIAEMVKQVPKQKKQGFILFMFRESAKAGKSGNTKLQSKLNDPKFMDVQLLQMNMLLKDRTKAKDKKTKQALQMYDAYMNWEKAKAAKKTA